MGLGSLAEIQGGAAKNSCCELVCTWAGAALARNSQGKVVARIIFILILWLFLTSLSYAAPVKILPLGDSITQGGNGFPSYRRDLWQMLDSAGYSVDFVGSGQGFFGGPVAESLKDFDLDHEGHAGWEASQIADNLSAWLQGYDADIALVHAGTNDLHRGQTISSTLNELGDILSGLRTDNPNITILLAQLIPMRDTEVSGFNTALASWVTDKSTATSTVILIDQYTGFDPQDDNYDNWHPDASGEQKIAVRWFDSLTPLLLSGGNEAPQVNAGSDQSIASELEMLTLTGAASDDGLPVDSTLAVSWSQFSGPGEVIFGDPTALVTTAGFSVAGQYILQLSASDGELTATDEVSITVGSVTSATLEGLVGRWQFDEATGVEVVDSSGFNNDAVLLGGAEAGWDNGFFDAGLCLTGVDGQHAQINTVGSELQPGSVTLSAWVKVGSSISTWGWIAAQGDNYGLAVNHLSTDGLEMYHYTGAGWSAVEHPGGAPRDNQWHHYAGSFNAQSNTLKIYRDGVLLSSAAGGNLIEYSFGDGFTLGSMQGQRVFTGCLDEIQVYDRALTDAEVLVLATPLVVTPPPSVTSYDLANNTWQLLSLPLDSGTNSVTDIFSGVLNPDDYLQTWVLFKYTPGVGYTSPALTDAIQPGVGYWVLQNSGAMIQLGLPGTSTRWPVVNSAACSSADGCYEIALASQADVAWNLIGSAADYAVDLDAMRVQTTAGSCANGCTMTEALEDGYLHDQMWTYSGNTYQPLSSGDVLPIWAGAWLPVFSAAPELNLRLLLPVD